MAMLAPKPRSRKVTRSVIDIIADLDKNGASRDRLEKKFWAAVEKLNDEWDALIEELKNA